MIKYNIIKIRIVVIISILIPLCLAFLIDNKALLVFADISIWGLCIAWLKIKKINK